MKKVLSVFGLAVILGGSSTLSMASSSHEKHKSSAKEMSEQITVIPLTNMELGETKVWLPAEIKAPHGKVKFILRNTLDLPHGFQIPGVMKEGVVVPGKEVVELPVLNLSEKKRYELKCHMHPAHVSAFVETY